MTKEVLFLILTHAALKCCLITWRRYILMMENMGCLFFLISWVNTTYVATMARFMLANIPVLLQLHCTPYKGVELNSKRNTSPKGGKDWALVSLFTIKSTFFSQKYLIKNMHGSLSQKKCQLHTEKLTCTKPFPPFEEVVRLLFNWILYKMRSCDAGEFLHSFHLSF